MMDEGQKERFIERLENLGEEQVRLDMANNKADWKNSLDKMKVAQDWLGDKERARKDEENSRYQTERQDVDEAKTRANLALMLSAGALLVAILK